MKKNTIIILGGSIYPRKRYDSFEWAQALYRQYRVKDFDFEVEIFSGYATILHIHPVGDWSTDLLQEGAFSGDILKAEKCLIDFLSNIPTLKGVDHKFYPTFSEWGD